MMKRLVLVLVLVYMARPSLADAAEPLRGPSPMEAIGAPVHNQPPVGIDDLKALEPVCVLVLAYLKRYEENPKLGYWFVQLKDSPLLDLPEYRIAKGATSFHHVCWSEVNRYRYYKKTNRLARLHQAGTVSGGYKFVIDHPEYLPKNWPHMAQMYVGYGNGLLLEEKSDEAIGAFMAAIKIDPRYVPAYDSLADTLVNLNDKAKALEQVAEGLRYRPDSKNLKRRYDELGGKPPYPEPYPEAQTEPEAVAPTEKSEIKATFRAAQSAVADEPKSQPVQIEPSSGQPKDNPYCRFCP